MQPDRLKYICNLISMAPWQQTEPSISRGVLRIVGWHSPEIPMEDSLTSSTGNILRGHLALEVCPKKETVCLNLTGGQRMLRHPHGPGSCYVFPPKQADSAHTQSSRGETSHDCTFLKWEFN